MPPLAIGRATKKPRSGSRKALEHKESIGSFSMPRAPSRPQRVQATSHLERKRVVNFVVFTAGISSQRRGYYSTFVAKYRTILSSMADCTGPDRKGATTVVGSVYWGTQASWFCGTDRHRPLNDSPATVLNWHAVPSVALRHASMASRGGGLPGPGGGCGGGAVADGN